MPIVVTVCYYILRSNYLGWKRNICASASVWMLVGVEVICYGRTRCSTIGTRVPGIIFWSCSSSVVRGTANNPDSAKTQPDHFALINRAGLITKNLHCPFKAMWQKTRQGLTFDLYPERFVGLEVNAGRVEQSAHLDQDEPVNFLHVGRGEIAHFSHSRLIPH